MASATLSMAAVANCSTPLKSLQPSRKSFNDFSSLKASEFYGTASIPCSRKKADLQVTWRTSAIGSSAQKRSLVVEAKLKVAINGFGRIGRNFLRCWHGRKDSPLDVIVINDTGGIKQASHLLKYDSTLGIFEADVKVAGDDGISVDGKVIKVVSDRNPVNLPWGSKDKGWVSKPLPSLKPKKNYGFKFNFSQNTYPL